MKKEKKPVFGRRKLVSELEFRKNTVTSSDANSKYDNNKFVSYTKRILKNPELIIEVTYYYERKVRDGKWVEYGKPYVALCVDSAVDIPLLNIKNNADLTNFIGHMDMAIKSGIGEPVDK